MFSFIRVTACTRFLSKALLKNSSHNLAIPPVIIGEGEGGERMRVRGEYSTYRSGQRVIADQMRLRPGEVYRGFVRLGDEITPKMQRFGPRLLTGYR